MVIRFVTWSQKYGNSTSNTISYKEKPDSMHWCSTCMWFQNIAISSFGLSLVFTSNMTMFSSNHNWWKQIKEKCNWGQHQLGRNKYSVFAVIYAEVQLWMSFLLPSTSCIPHYNYLDHHCSYYPHHYLVELQTMSPSTPDIFLVTSGFCNLQQQIHRIIWHPLPSAHSLLRYPHTGDYSIPNLFHGSHMYSTASECTANNGGYWDCMIHSTASIVIDV